MCNAFRFCSLRAWLAQALFAASLLTSLSVQAASPEQASLLADAADGRLDETPLLEAAVIAGGGNQEEMTAARRRLEAVWLEVGQPLIDRLPLADRPRAILSALHRLVLTGEYKAECTEVQQTLSSGDYNCVTATVLYLELCRRHGLAGSAVAIPAHVYCRLHGAEEQRIPQQDIQTTCREWFEVASKSSNAFATEVAAQPEPPRALSDVELLGKVYYNRGVSQLEAHGYAAAIALLQAGLALDPHDEPARNNLLAAHNNWALALCDAADFPTAAAKLAAGRAIDAQYGPLLTNDLYVHQKWVLHLCERSQYSAAAEVLEEGFQRRPEATLFRGGRYAVYGMWAKSLLKSNRREEAIRVLDSARRRYGDSKELAEQEIGTFEAAVTSLLTQGDAQGARAVLSAALARHPQADSLRQLKIEPPAAIE